MFIKYAGSGAALLLMILLMIIKYNSGKKGKPQIKKNDIISLINNCDRWNGEVKFKSRALFQV